MRLLERPPDGVEVLLLHGMGGIGKTTAAKFAYHAASLHYGEGNTGHCKLDPSKRCDQDHLGQALWRMLSHLGLSPRQNAGLDELHTLMLKDFSARQRPVLLLVDDVSDSHVAAQLLRGPAGTLADMLPKG